METLGEFREDLQYSFDYEYFQRILFAGFRPMELDAIVAMFRVHHSSKTASNAAGFAADDQAVADRYFNRVSAQYQQRLIAQKRKFMAWQTVDQYAKLAQSRGPRVARRGLWLHVLRNPRLLQYRPVWGALRRYAWTA
jgi:hypothetical protein